MDRVRAGLEFNFIYMDNILVTSMDEQSHFSHLRQLFVRLCEFRLVRSLEKCQFGHASLGLLAHRISTHVAEHADVAEHYPVTGLLSRSPTSLKTSMASGPS
jgi:hypothetical protein